MHASIILLLLISCCLEVFSGVMAEMQIEISVILVLLSVVELSGYYYFLFFFSQLLLVSGVLWQRRK